MAPTRVIIGPFPSSEQGCRDISSSVRDATRKRECERGERAWRTQNRCERNAKKAKDNKKEKRNNEAKSGRENSRKRGRVLSCTISFFEACLAPRRKGKENTVPEGTMEQKENERNLDTKRALRYGSNGGERFEWRQATYTFIGPTESRLLRQKPYQKLRSQTSAAQPFVKV